VDMLTRVNARVAGAVLNGIDRRRDRSYTYYSYRQERSPRSPLRSILSRLS
jgi:hypothetical protein